MRSPNHTDGLRPGNPTVSVIVPVHNAGEAFARCLQSIHSASPGPDEVIIVLDGAEKDPAVLGEQTATRVVRTTQQAGPASARNLGASLARGDIFLFIDADVTVPRQVVEEVRRFFSTHPEISALIGSYDDDPMSRNFLSRYKNLFHHYVHQNAREEGYTFWGACGAVRREAFLDVGGFDEKYRQPCIEDIELGYRLKAAGHRIRLRKGLQVKHHKRWGALSLLRADFCHRALPWTELILRAGRLENDLNIDRANRVKVGLAQVLAALLVLSWWQPEALLPASAVALLLLALDAQLWQFFRKRNGIVFVMRAIPWHWFYYWYSGLGFAVGLALYLGKRGGGRKLPPKNGSLARSPGKGLQVV
jgi:GT2 family glycosyltransferase